MPVINSDTVSMASGVAPQRGLSPWIWWLYCKLVSVFPISSALSKTPPFPQTKLTAKIREMPLSMWYTLISTSWWLINFNYEQH